ncbi:phage antirepressor [Clostridium saccharobutylicum]|uniref:Prophage antirepressor n=1 Tax=Clostridium saccharobutylicum DSM 13864 TaxID=1345695 RepID=U5MLJ2_CLOSA|nr:phage antirepressor KilAC domain-containing protein [Clostridium saccharobutylicum]AGX41450.1 prophage antirepressor [Clostridium saccharobutylicum DSM 13864]AQR88731.1 phage antirepressor protein KilAC domain protein [Clostridium saccharobutylicum]AQR98629.1 phage antirepressor protein KilAC domain protein [Clostridium saccharobutylicum]AQS12619.1 phage antirepressor protein KilAC domain protein [Clostridium saccharobutylicum]MBA2905637.1 prophage antirepressor-like protein [Clostridium sa
MGDLRIFKDERFGEIRWVKVNNKDYAVGIDIAKALGYKKPNDAISRHCRGSVKHGVGVVTGKRKDGTDAIQNVEMSVIPESDIYRLVSKSELPGAEKFESWIFDEVLPSIRKTGMYATDELLNNPDLLIATVTKLKEEREAKLKIEKKIKLLESKVQFYDDVAGSKDSIEMGHVAKVLGIKGMGRNRLFSLLRAKKVLDKNNIPYQQFVDSGFFRVLEQKYTVSNGQTKINIKTMVFQKGIDFILRKIREQ